MSDRGMKKWLPFRSLVEQGLTIDNLRKERNKIDRPQISIDKAEEINEILCNYQEETLTIKIFDNGRIYDIEDKIIKIDTVNQRLKLKEYGLIDFKNILDMQSNKIYFQ